jgi:DNA-binding protein YbaB
MFGQLKDMYNLQKQAREMKKQLEAEEITGVSKDGMLNLTINGSYELVRVHVKEEAQLSPSQIEQNIRQAYDDANSRLRQILTEKFKGMM